MPLLGKPASRREARKTATRALEALRTATSEPEMYKALAAGAWAGRWLAAEQSSGVDWKCPLDAVPTGAALAAWLKGTESGNVRCQHALEKANQHLDKLLGHSEFMVMATDGEKDDAVYTVRKCQETGSLVATSVFEGAHGAWFKAAQSAANRKKKAPAHPLAGLVAAWQIRPRPVLPENRPKRILPSRLAMVQPEHRCADRGLFSIAAHRPQNSDWPVLPGFEIPEVEGPALPLALYDLGVGPNMPGGTHGAPLGLRLWIESVLAVPLDERSGDRPVAMEMSLRDLLARLYPGKRRPRPHEYWPRLMAAVQALDSPEARIPWHDSTTGRGGSRRVVSASDIPRGPNALDDVVTLTVHLPPGAKDGPIMPKTLAEWGVRGAAPYRALINLSFRWHEPGRTRIPIQSGRHIQTWVQSQDPNRYDRLTDEELIRLCFPCSATRNRREMLRRAYKALQQLETAGEVRIVDKRRILPPRRKRMSG